MDDAQLKRDLARADTLVERARVLLPSATALCGLAVAAGLGVFSLTYPKGPLLVQVLGIFLLLIGFIVGELAVRTRRAFYRALKLREDAQLALIDAEERRAVERGCGGTGN